MTENGACPEPTGANRCQEFPVVTAAAGPSAAVGGTLSSDPGTTYRIEVFASTAADPSGNGEGERFLGAVEATTDGAGNATWLFADPVATIGDGEVATATATELAGDGSPLSTSEFSDALAAPTCHLEGNGEANTLAGGPAAEVICGLGAGDTLSGGGGRDAVLGGDGDDAIYVADGEADALVDCGPGTDAAETIKGTGKADVIATFGGKDTVKGLGGNDRLRGEAGDDRLDGGSGKDTLQGGSGADRLKGAGGGGDVCDGQGGRDKLDGAKAGCEKPLRL